MTSDRNAMFGRRESHWLVFCTALLLYLMVQSIFAKDLITLLKVPGNDDAMRLSAVRDLLAGQAWFDTTQYRATPPEGVSLHWSRLIDAALAALILLYSAWFSSETALAMAAGTWPIALFIVYLVLTARTAKSVFGYSAASFALLAASLNTMISVNYFPLGRVDHHNLQIVCMLAICAAIIIEGRPLVRGLLAGAVSALSLAISLEALVFIATAGFVLVLQYVLNRPGSTKTLLGYGGALGAVSPLLFLIQTAPEGWSQPHCDQLSWRILTITTAALFGSTVLAVAGRFLEGRASRLVLSLVLGGAVLLVLWPLLSPCRGGPYGALSPELRASVIDNIVEATSLANYFSRAPWRAIEIVLPLVVTVFLAVLLVVRKERSAGFAGNRFALGVVIVFLLLGILGSLYQVRALIWGLAVLPLASGVVIAWLANGHTGRPSPLRIVGASVLVVAMLLPFLITKNPLVTRMIPVFESRSPARLSVQGHSCDKPASIRTLNKLPTSLIMAPLNLGPEILLYTRHSVTAVPYHRNPKALANGLFPFMGSEAGMARKVRSENADYILVCAGEVYGAADSIGSRIARGDLPNWLMPVDIGAEPVSVLKVLRSRRGGLMFDDDRR